MFPGVVDYFRRRRRNRDRQLFRYFDGRRTLAIDPLEVHIALELHDQFNWNDGDLLVAGDPEVTQRVISTVCDVFHVEKWDGETGRGLTGAECLEVFDSYLAYCEEVKKNTDPGLISPPPTESESCSPPPTQQESAANNCSVSG